MLSSLGSEPLATAESQLQQPLLNESSESSVNNEPSKDKIDEEELPPPPKEEVQTTETEKNEE